MKKLLLVGIPVGYLAFQVVQAIVLAEDQRSYRASVRQLEDIVAAHE